MKIRSIALIPLSMEGEFIYTTAFSDRSNLPLEKDHFLKLAILQLGRNMTSDVVSLLYQDIEYFVTSTESSILIFAIQWYDHPSAFSTLLVKKILRQTDRDTIVVRMSKHSHHREIGEMVISSVITRYEEMIDQLIGHSEQHIFNVSSGKLPG